MTTVFLICAIFGGTLFVCQLILAALGIGDHHDLSVDHDVSHGGGVGFWGLLSFRAIVSALTVFGLSGMASFKAGLASPFPVLIAAAAGVVMFAGVIWIMRTMGKFTDDGTSHIENARGATGIVYLPIPGDQQGPGKVHLELQNRTVELKAVTHKAALETGTKIVVIDVIAPDTVEVIAVPLSR